MKEYAVIGLGSFGFNIAKTLALRGNNIIAIDSNPAKVDEIKNYVREALTGDAKNKHFLTEFIDKNIDGVIISMGSDMVGSLLAVHYLKAMGIRNIIVKANNEVHAELLQNMGVTDIIFPERDIAELLARRIMEPGLLDYVPLTSDFSIAELECPASYTGKTLRELGIRSKYNILVIAVKEILSDEYLLLPDPDYIFIPDSIITILGKKKNIDKFKLTKNGMHFKKATA